MQTIPGGVNSWYVDSVVVSKRVRYTTLLKAIVPQLIQVLGLFLFLFINGEHWWRLSPLNYRWRCGRSGPASVIMISQHAFNAMCLCYLSINFFLWFFINLLYNSINDTKNVKLWKLCTTCIWTERKGIKIMECTCICIHI
jgi:hypothetical protein